MSTNIKHDYYISYCRKWCSAAKKFFGCGLRNFDYFTKNLNSPNIYIVPANPFTIKIFMMKIEPLKCNFY